MNWYAKVKKNSAATEQRYGSKMDSGRRRVLHYRRGFAALGVPSHIRPTPSLRESCSNGIELP